MLGKASFEKVSAGHIKIDIYAESKRLLPGAEPRKESYFSAEDVKKMFFSCGPMPVRFVQFFNERLDLRSIFFDYPSGPMLLEKCALSIIELAWARHIVERELTFDINVGKHQFEWVTMRATPAGISVILGHLLSEDENTSLIFKKLLHSFFVEYFNATMCALIDLVYKEYQELNFDDPEVISILKTGFWTYIGRSLQKLDATQDVKKSFDLLES